MTVSEADTKNMDSSTTKPMLSIKNLKKVYQVADGEIEAVRNLTFDVADGELICIVGPSGAGKTTLLKCIAGLLTPSSGSIELAGSEVTGPPKAMAVVFQEYGRSLYPWMSVGANVELPLKSARLPKAERRERTATALEAVGLVRRVGDPDDGRRIIVQVTDEGHALIDETRNRRNARMRAEFALLSPEDRAAFVRVSELMAEMLRG